MPTTQLANLPFLNDKAGTYGVTYATVLTTGNDSTGVAASTQAGADAYPFLSLGIAAAAIKAYNNTNHGRNTVGGGIIYVGAGNFTSLGSFTGGNTDTWCHVFPHPTLGAGVITNGPYYQTMRGLWHWGIAWNVNQALIMLGSWSWFDGTDLTILGAEAIGDSSMTWLTNAKIHSLVLAGGGDPAYFGVTRGCVSDNSLGAGGLVVAGCAKITGGGGDGCIIAFNTDYSEPNAATFCPGTDNSIGVGYLCNIFERVTSDPIALFEFSAINLTNLIGFHNTCVGNRFNHENAIDTPAPGPNKTFTDWCWKFNNFNARGNHRMDIRNMDATMVGCWSVDNSVGWLGNWNEALSYAGDQDFWGLYSNTWGGFGHVGYVMDAGNSGGTDAGNGNYNAASSGSHSVGMVPAGGTVIPYDILGRPVANNGTGLSGALQTTFTSGSPMMRRRRESGMFQHHEDNWEKKSGPWQMNKRIAA
jgi:hypothetical protein